MKTLNPTRNRLSALVLGISMMLFTLFPRAHPFFSTPHMSLPATALSITAGHYHTCLLTSSGGAKCWGRNTTGQLGDGTTTNRLTPVDVSGLTSGVTAIAGGDFHTCALTSGGGVKCWGDNHYGQLGDGTIIERHTPVDVSGLTSGVIAISTGGEATCALTNNGGVKCWGRNDGGTLGNGTTTGSSTPVDVIGLTSGVTAISAHHGHNCALTSGGGVKCWGYNDNGRVGDGTTINRLTPVDVIGLTSGVTVIALGAAPHTCALTSGGEVKCWGYNNSGQLGDGTTADRLTAVEASGLTSGVTDIAVGVYHTCALMSVGGLKCWGRNDFGQLGDGTTAEDSLTPVHVSGLTSGVAAMAAGRDHTCALMSGGGVKCWGHNDYGQLGDDTTTDRHTPVDVVWIEPTPTPTFTPTNTPVLFNFTGFFQPVDNPPILNRVNAGSAIPVKFSLGGNHGLSIFDASYPRSQVISCDSTAQVDGIEETATAGSSGLLYDSGSDTYTYVWKTDKVWAGTCRQLIVKLNDGTSHRANFKLTK